jgi:deoxyribodipyrimidine photo-lyase
MKKTAVFWFRRDLRLHDNAGLYHALKSGDPVLLLFIFDKHILGKLANKADARVEFIHNTITGLSEALGAYGSSLKVVHATPLEAFQELAKDYVLTNVYSNHDYEPDATERDASVKNFLESKGIGFHTYKDQCIFEKDEVTKDDGKPYTVFTPYSRKWKAAMKEFYIKPYPTKYYLKNVLPTKPFSIPSLKELGFEKTGAHFPANTLENEIIRHYHQTRDIPGIKGTTRLSLHLRFGTVSIRALVKRAMELNETWLNELIWRDFYMMILHHFPHSAKDSFKPQYDRIHWRNNETEFTAWCEGRTGFPIVDAGMRELNETGFMHNRVRMIVSSFLVKDLLIDWRWGEAYFAEKLLDYDLSANVGGWQWAAGSGCDAAPYFRVFNPTEQQKKFDPEFKYIKRWIPEYGTTQYPQPIVDHAAARLRALKVYKEALSDSTQTSLF